MSWWMTRVVSRSTTAREAEYMAAWRWASSSRALVQMAGQSEKAAPRSRKIHCGNLASRSRRQDSAQNSRSFRGTSSSKLMSTMTGTFCASVAGLALPPRIEEHQQRMGRNSTRAGRVASVASMRG